MSVLAVALVGASTVTVITPELIAAHAPLVTVALKYRVAESVPTCTPMRVVEFEPTFVTLVVNAASSAICH